MEILKFLTKLDRQFDVKLYKCFIQNSIIIKSIINFCG